jgi:hypothetical protein
MENLDIPPRLGQRLRVRLSIRTLMLLVLVVGCGLGWLIHRANLQRDAVATIKRAGGQVRYDWQFKDGRMVANGAPGGPKWLEQILGPDYFNTVTDLSLTKQITDSDMEAVANLTKVDTMVLDPTGLSDVGLARLDRMPGLRWLTISGGPVGMDARILPRETASRLRGLTLAGTDLTNSGLNNLLAHPGLELLDLSGTKITDEGLARLDDFAGLKHLYLDDTQIGDEGLSRLERVTTLETLSVKGTKITAAGLAKFRKGRPKVVVF